jgi:YgiT-type zinc finger domain-containing protein
MERKIHIKKIITMECVICKNGTTRLGNVTVTLERSGSIIAIKEVPAQVCQNCGEYFLDAEMTKEVLKRAEQAVKKGVEIEVIKMEKVA